MILDGTSDRDGDDLYRKSVIESNSNLMLRSLGSSQVPSNTSSNFTLDVQVVLPEKYLHYVFILENCCLIYHPLLLGHTSIN